MYRRVSTEWASGAGLSFSGRGPSSAEVGNRGLEELLMSSDECRLGSGSLLSRTILKRCWQFTACVKCQIECLCEFRSGWVTDQQCRGWAEDPRGNFSNVLSMVFYLYIMYNNYFMFESIP